MNPYARFRLVSNAVSAALVLTVLAAFGGRAADIVATMAAGDSAILLGASAGAVGVLVVFWVTMTEAIFPSLFRFDTVRRVILGKYYMEGTWLQSERGDGQSRMSVIDIQPKGDGFMFTGYSLNENLEIESNTRIEFSRFDWPFMTYKHRNSLSDGSDGLSEGVGELQFEMNRSAARRYNGFLQYVRGQQRMKIEGVKLTKGSEVKRLRSLEGRREICSKYWELFYNRPIGTPAPAAAPAAISPAPLVEEPSFVERRSTESAVSGEGDVVIPRRRASDWTRDVAAEPELDIDKIVEEARRSASDAKVAVAGDDYRKAPAL